MQDITFPINFQFKISTFSNDFTATDANGQTLAYVKQKMFKLKEDVLIYSDETKQTVNYRIKADRWLDFSAAYTFYDEMAGEFGKIVRKGWRSLWKAEYKIIDEFQKEQYIIKEESVWVRIFDSLLGEIPIINFLAGYFFNPTYIVSDLDNMPIVKLTKLRSFWGRKFELTKVSKIDNNDDDRIMLGLMMMILLERRRG